MNRDQRDILIELLVLQSQSGDPRAMNELAEMFHNDLGAYAYRLVGNLHSAQDIVQEVWLSVVRSIGRLQDPAQFRSWVFRIAHNKSMDYLRTVVRDRDELKTLDGIRSGNPTATPPAADNDLATIRHLIESLPAAERAFVVLFYEHELSIREIAAITGKTESATKSKLFQIRQNLKRSLTQSERDNDE